METAPLRGSASNHNFWGSGWGGGVGGGGGGGGGVIT